uniref:putative Ig domain-containing protein n=1 Tax=Tychonema sp. LEGE 07196 TaxID=1828665 RepID=UPI0030D90977
MPLTDPIGEPLIEVESLIPGLAPTFAPQLPGIPTHKTLLYQTPGSSENSEQPNLIETAKPPQSEFSRAETDAFITNKASDIHSIPSATISELRTNSNPRDAANSEIDPLIGKFDSDSGDSLTNPNPITSPVITTSTTSEKASPKTPLPATPETSSKSEDIKTPLSSEATFKSESEPNKTSPATASTIIPDRSTTSSEKSETIAVTNLTETIAASPNIPSTDKTSTDKQSPVAKADDKIDSDKQSQNSTIVEKTNSGEPSRTAEVSDKIDSDKKAPIPSTSETKNSEKQLPLAEASTLIDSDKKSPTVDAIPTEKPSSNSQEPLTTQPPTAPLIPALSNPVLPDTNINPEVNSTDSTNPVQTASQALTDKQNDSEKVDPLKTEPAAIPKTAASENVAVTTATAVQTPEKSPNNTDSVSELKQPVQTESLVNQSVGAESIKTDQTETASISQPPAETESITAPLASQSPAKTDSLVSNVGEQSPKETNSNVSTASEELPTKNKSIITAEINSGTVVLDIPVAQITGELETEQLPTKNESIIAVPEADDTVEHNIPVAEITAELETEQFPTKTDSLAPAEFTAGTIKLDITVAFIAKLETDQTPAITVNSLESDSLISNSNQHIQTDNNSIPALFSTPSETAAVTTQITEAEVETTVAPSTLKSPPEPTSNTYNSNSNPIETVAVLPADSDTEIAPESAEITSGLLASATEKSAQLSDNIADTQSYSTQSTGNFQSNINPQINLSITSAANSPIPGTFLVDNQGKVRFDYVFDGGGYEGELGIFSLAGMSAFIPGTPEFIAEASRRVLSNSTNGHIVISDSIEGAKFTGAMPFDGDWDSGEYQGIKTFSMLPGDTFAVMLVPNGTVQSSLQSSYSGNWFPENRPLFSIATANPNDTSYVLQVADVTGTGNTFALEDMSAANSDGDYNDLIFTVLGATGNAPLLDSVINPDREWRSTPLGQQLIEYANSQVPSDTAPPAIAAALVNDTGSNSTDGITNNPAISGTITDASDIASFRASFSRESTGIELKDLLTSDGSFALTPNTLSTVNGNTLTDGTYTLYLLASDSEGNTSTFELPFTLDTTPPELTFGLNPAFDTPPIGDGQTLDSTVTLTGQTDPGSTVILAETGAITTADSTGRFEFAGVTLALGSNSFTATATDKAGNESTASRTFTRTEATDSGVIWLAEGTSFTEKLERPITIPAVPSTLTVNIAGLNFDASDSDSIKDAFEIALVDASGRSLVHTVGTGLNSFFNFTEGQPPQRAPGVTFNGSNISVDLSQITPGTAATLQVRLVNNDSDTATQVGITSIAIQPLAVPTAPVTASPFEDVSPNVPVNFNRLQDVGSLLEAEYKQTSFNSNSKILYADLAVKNAGQYPVRDTLLVGINNISDPTVRLLDADGMTPEGIPYYDISKLVGDGILKPGELTSTDTLKFYNPQGVQFSYDLVFLSQLNQVPQFKATPNTEALVGKSYVYTAIAIDADGDALTYSLLEKPLGMEIDAQTGKISWPTVAGDIGNHAVTVEVGDGKGGVAKQKYVLSAINPPPNRPPIFTSTPVVDAWINTPYRYDSDASDPDSDTIGYKLILGPEGMKVNPQTGLVEWTPPAVLVLGDTVLGKISLPGESDEFSFSGTAGQRIYIDPLQYSGAAGNWKFDIISPSGETVSTNLDSNKILNLTETGNYRIVTSTNGDATGSYGFSVIDLGLVPAAPFDTTIKGTLSPGSEDDIYRFTGSKGQKLFFDNKDKNNTGNLDWVLYTADNKIAISDGYFNDMELYLPNDGEYVLALRGKSSFTSTVDYSFEIITPDEITVPIIPGSNATPNSIYGEIKEKGEKDFYTFTGEPGQRIYFDRLFHKKDIPNYYWLDTVKIISPSGINLPIRNLEYGDDGAPFTLKESGTYRIEIDAAGENTGTYSFSILDLESSAPISLDTNISATLDPGQETHLYQFTGLKNQRLFLDTPGGTVNTNWTLYDAGNNIVPGGNNYQNTDMEVVLPNTGTYTLAIKGNNGTNPVNYSFKVITPDVQSGTLAFNLPVSGNIGEKGEQDVYTFTGTKGQRVFLDTLMETPNNKATLVSPSGTKVIDGYNSLLYADGYWRSPVILPENGTYSLTVDGSGESTDSYSFRLIDINAAPVLQKDAPSPTSGTLDPGSAIQFYQFTGAKGDRVYFDSQENSPNTNWHLYNSNNNELSEVALASDFEYVLPGDGNYYLMLRGENSTPVNYKVQLVTTTDSPSPIALNSLVSNSIGKLGEQDIYTFTGTVGQTLYFDPRIGNSNITVKIENPNGKVVLTGNTGSDKEPFTLTEPGTYKVTVDGNTNTIGDYSFFLKDTALSLPLASPFNGTLAAQETVLYKVDGTAGQRLVFDSQNPNSGGEWVLYAPQNLLNPDYYYENNRAGWANLNSDFTRTLPTDGTYILALRNTSVNPVPYNVLVNSTLPPSTPNSGLGVLHDGTLSVPGEVDDYSFTAASGTLIYFDGQGNDWTKRVRLYNPDGTEFFTNLDNQSDYGAYQLTQTGSYKLQAYGYYSDTTTGNYSFQLVDLKASPTLGLNAPLDVPLNPRETKAYKFTGAAGQKVWLDGLNTSNPNVTARLLNSSGREIASNTNLQGDTTLQTLEANGEYYLVLQSNNTSATTASFRLLDNSAGATFLPNLDNSNIFGNFGTSKLETVLYKFQGSENQRLYFDITDGDWYNYYQLYSPDGKQLFSQYGGWDYELKLPNSGEYLLAFTGNNQTNNNYGLRIITPTDVTLPLPIGNTESGEITKAGQQNTYTFTGTEGQHLWFDSLAAAGNITGTLYSPTGVQLWSQGVGADREPTVLNETGAYRFVVDGNADATGTYSFRFLDLAAANPTTLDANIEGNFGTSKREAHVYKFAGAEGQSVYFDRTEGNSYNSYYLYAPDGQRLLFQYIYSDSDLVKLPSSGEYTLVFSGNEQPDNNYKLRVVTPDIVTQPPHTIGNSIKGEISEAGEYDTYTFTGSPGQKLWFDSLFASSNITAYLSSPTKKDIWSQNAGYDHQLTDLLTLDEAGTYTLKVDASGDSTGAYEFRFLDSIQANTTLLDSPIEGNFGTGKQSANAYKFTGNKGQPLYFDRSDRTDYNDYYNSYYLYDSYGKRVLGQSLSYDYELSALPNEGEYTLIFAGNDRPNNNYSLKIVTPDLITTPYQIGDTASGTISEAGEQDTYTFPGTIGQKLWFDSLENSPANLTLKLVDPDGVTVFGEWYNGQYASYDREPVILTKQGNYKLIVDGSADSAGDTYSFRLLDLAAGEQLTLDSPISGDFGSSKREAKVYKFQGAEGSYLYFDLTAGDPYNYYYLYDPYGKRLTYQGLGTDYELALPLTGEYALVLSGQDRPNNYGLTVVMPELKTVPLTLGQTVTQSIDKAGEKDTYSFEGKVGEKLFFDGITGNGNLSVQLYDPFGNLVVDPSGYPISNRSTNSDWLPQALTANGTYRLVIDASNNTTGNYSFKLSDLTSSSPLNLTSPNTGTAEIGEVDLYQIIGSQGQVLNFDLNAAAWNNGNWVLYGPDNKAIATPQGNSPDFLVALPTAGLYTLAVTGNNTSPVSYSFRATDITPAPTASTGLNSTISGTLTAGNPKNYKFTANAGTQIFLDSINNSNWEIRSSLIAPDGSKVFDNQDSRYNTLPKVLPLSGEYTLQIYGYYPSSNGSYQFRIAELPNSLRSPTTNYLEIGSPVSGTLSGTEAKVYTFDGVEGLRVAFNGIVGTNVSATLYSPTGEAVFTRGNFQSTDFPPVTLTQNGLYQLVIEGEQASNQNYSFQLLELSSAASMPFNLPVTGALTNGQQSKFYKFEGNQGDRLFFDSIVGNSSNLWKLIGPDNKVVNGGSNWLGNDLEVELPATGEYALLIEGGTSSAPVNYQFRAFRYEKTAADVVTPGTGEAGSNAGTAGLYPVKLEASDGQGGKDVQEYSIRVWPDPTNANPVIVSEPVSRFGLDDKIYRYQVAALDPDGDRLKYRLVDGPLGALINGDSGELLWFPENVASGSKADFTVEVADPRGGKGLQKFTVDAYGALGKIQGAVFDDLNGNGFRDSKLVKGNNPAIIVAIDVSGSTAAPFAGPAGVDDVLKAQVAATLTLIDTLIAQGLGDRVNIGLIPHKDTAQIQDMDPATPGVQPYTTPLADKNNNGIPDIREILASDTYTIPNGHNDFTRAVEAIDQLVPYMPGDKNIIFMSDGYGALDATVSATVRADLTTKGIGLTAFGIGQYSTLDTIKKLDPEAVILSDIDQLSSVFGGFDPRYTIEPLMENVPVYLDLNNNGVLDPDEPKQLTKKDDSESILGQTNYQFTFDNLVPGTYKVRAVAPSDYIQTAPSSSVFTDTVTAAGQTFTHLFGVHKDSQEPVNSDPTFLTVAPPFGLKAGEPLVYRALASDPDADEVTYSLVLNPPGMSVDPKNGTVVWTPTAAQVEEYYKELRATRDRLIAFGRGDSAPSTVKFNVVLRATDGKGGQALQYVEVELIPPNNPPLFASIPPSDLQPQIGKRFEYRAVAADADGDIITYALLPNAPAGITVNPTTGLVTWTPTAGQLGTNSFTVKATDGKGGESKLEVPLRVIEAIPNRPPDITSDPRTSARTGSGYFYKLAVTDPDGNPISFTLVSKPAGMTVDSEGLVSWIPTAAQTGPIAVSVSASDGQGGTDTQSWTVNVSNSTANRLPSITSVPDTVTNLEKVYRYQLTGTDPDGDYLLWSLDSAPKGMVIDTKTGGLSWQPTSEQIGEHTVAVRVTDSLGSYTGQEFSLKVTGINTPPAIVSIPVTIAGVNGTYKYQVFGTDPENDTLRYSLGTKPEGMKIDARTGLIEWTPGANFVGSHTVEVLATDTQGGVGNQKFAVSVGTAAINLPPTVVSTPVFAASLGSQYSYPVQATDPEGGSLTYQLLKAPMGMAINAATGLLTWDNPTAGNHQIVVGAADAGGLGAAQGFTLTARANSTPIVPAVPVVQSAVVGSTYRYDLRATDAEGDLLAYSLIQSPSGMTVDEFGRISWTPQATDVGTTGPVQVAITDTFGKTVSVSYNLSVVADTSAPKVNIVASKNTANLGDSVTFTVNAVDNVKVESLGLTINGTPVVLDAQGQASVKVNNLGNFTAIATAKDSAGNAGTATQTVAAIDPTDVNAPVINIALEDDAEITAPFNITGTISDSNLAYYTLEVAPVGGGQIPGDGGGFKEVYRGTTAVSNGTVATFDPTVLANGAYVLKFTAFDANGNGSTTERTVNVAGDLKLGNFRLSFTDLTVPVAGIPINVTRTYDSLNANNSDDFGYGWRMEFRDTDLKTSLKADPIYEELGINTVAFDSKTKVFITLPGGKRETFTFKPTPSHLNQYLGAAGPGAAMYKPAFESQKGSTVTLTVKDANLVRNEYGEYYGVNGQPFNPENPAFGSVYVLTTKEGLVYEIDAKSGDLLTATDANGNKLTFSDAGIASSTGKSVTFERDAAGRIVGVVDPDGKKVKYEYDAKGDLVAVKDRENNATRFVYEDEDRPHFLTEVIDSLGRSGVKTEYDEQGRLKQMVDANGSAVELVYDPNNSIQKVKDVFGKETTYVYDSRGNVLTEIDPLGKRVDRTFDGDNNVLTETVITTELNAAGVSVEV